jgi:hypothetical protein
VAIAYFGSPISPNQIETNEGYLICKNVPIARTGRQDYLAREVGAADADPEAVIPVMRCPEDVFAVETMASFEGKPVTMTHPPEDVTPENWSAYAKGHVQNVRRLGEHIVADLIITDPALIDQVRSGSMRQVSCGYRCNYTMDPTGGYRQKRIRGNHVAIVPQGRAGAAVSIQDAAPEAEKERKAMSKFSHAILTALGMAAKEASPEELDGLVATAATALDAEPAAKAPEAAPAADGMVESTPEGDGLGSKLDRLIEMVGQLAKKDAQEEKKERKMSDENDLEELIEKLTGEDGEEAVTVTEEETAPDPEVRDAALKILKNVRPAVAAIKDNKERARVVDALLQSMESSTMSGVLGAVTKAAKAKANDAAGPQQKYADRCREMEAAYAARNPHMKKEEK